MNKWTELEEHVDVESVQNRCELQKMVDIYERIGMNSQASEIKEMLKNWSYK